MQDMLADGLAWLDGQLKANASQTVTSARGYSSVDLPATYGMKLLKLDDGFGGIRLEWTDMDFGISAADLVLDGEQVEPARGDLIYIQAPTGVEIFEVFPFGNEPPWRWSDPHRNRYRIHTKHIDTEQFYS